MKLVVKVATADLEFCESNFIIYKEFLLFNLADCQSKNNTDVKSVFTYAKSHSDMVVLLLTRSLCLYLLVLAVDVSSVQGYLRVYYQAIHQGWILQMDSQSKQSTDALILSLLKRIQDSIFSFSPRKLNKRPKYSSDVCHASDPTVFRTM